MGLAEMTKALIYNQYNSEALRVVALPGIATGIGTTATSGAALTWGALIDIALPAAVLVDTLVIGIAVDTPSVAEIYTIEIGTTGGLANAAAVTAAGAAAILAASRRQFRCEIASDASGYAPYYFKEPVFYAALTEGIIGRIYTVGGADTLNLSAICLQLYKT